MKRLWKHCVVVLAVTTICFAQPASSPLRVNESAARIESLTSTLRLTLPLDHSVSAPVNASITLKLLDPEDKPRASSVTTLTLQSSQRTITAAIDQPLKNLETPDIENLVWYRISYEIRSDARSLLASGIIPIANRHSEIFRLFVAAAPNANEGRKYAVHVTTAAAQTTAPVPGVAITGELSWDQEEDENSSRRKLEAHATTDRFGEASLEFTLPPTLGRHEADLNIVARKGVVSRSVQQEVWLEPAGSALIDTDKEIYQPGQTIHIRALMFNSRRNAEAGVKVDVRISDQDETLIFRDTLETDKFGVAHDEWTIPPNVRLGIYAIDVRRAGVDNRERNIRWVRIYRYDLPSFSVETKPDRPYYLPGQNAVVSVSAEYLFGKPVSRASVRVVEEMQHHWNYREQKWETEDGQVRTGELDKDGRFTATFDLSQYFESLRSNDDQRFRDVTIAAYATDLTTGRTEQRRASLRLTRQPVHVYISEASEAAKGLPVDFFVSAFYADGTPAHCEIRLSLIDEIDESDAVKPGRYLATVKTNRYGLARLNGVLLSQNKVSGREALLAEARDGHGLTGTHSERLWLSDRDSIQLSTPRSIYRPDEPIEVSLLSTQPSARVVVDLVRDSQLLTSRTVLLRNGKGFVSFPFDPRFTDEIEIIAYCPESASGKFDFPYADRTVLYPINRRLQTQVHLQRGTYRPGDSAAATINVRLPDGGAAQSSLGIKIVDKAVEERSRTDREFRGDNGGWDPWWPWSSYEAFAGITRDDLDLVDLTRPIPPDLDLVAEFILSRSYRPGIKVEMDGSGSNPVLVFSSRFDRQFNPLQPVLESASVEGKVPANERELVELCRQHGVDVQSFTDPWGTPYRYTFDYDRNYRTVSIESAGPDKQFGTNDDFPARTIHWEYFTYYGLLLNRAAEDFLLAHGTFIRDRETLKQQLLQLGVDIDALRDPWGNLYQYRFAVERSWLIIYVLSGGPRWDGRSPFPATQEISVWREAQDYFTAARNQIQDALSRKLASGSAFPRTEEEFKAILKNTGVDLDLLRDPFDHPCYIRFKSAAEYGDKVVVRQQGPSRDQASVPLTMMKQAVQIMSPGLDNRPFTADDFILAEFSAFVTQQGASDVTPKPAPGVLINSSTGVISGTALDPQGAVISNAEVTARRLGTNEDRKTSADSSGRFVFTELPAGIYNLSVKARGFQIAQLNAITVQAGSFTEVQVTLTVGEVTTTVEVSAAPPMVETAQASVFPGRSNAAAASAAASGRVQNASGGAVMSTPRLRQYFPETLLWEPALLTDRHGRARLNFKLADNITTWKISALASTRTGELGRAEVDLRAFQPFFVEHDPPRVLTEGDVIDYPVVLRNYLDKKQVVTASIQPEQWFTLLGPGKQTVSIPAGDAANAVFRYRATAAIDAGKQRVTAANQQISDAAEKPLEVHPLGESQSQSDTELFYRSGSLNVGIPEDAVAGSVRGEIKIYPNLLSHLIESMEAGLEVPHGCGEQTISSAYPSLLLARFYAQSGISTPVAQKARRYLRAGYERLLGYQAEDGGFTYWGRGEPDLALTAYAVNFLTNAAALIDVNSTVIDQSRKWLISQQRKDGSWTTSWDHDVTDIIRRTAYIARVLAESPTTEDSSAEEVKSKRASIDKALNFLQSQKPLEQEPYDIANHALIAIAIADNSTAAPLLGELRQMVHHEKAVAYWNLERNTPFYAWGRPGRIESTAIVVRALSKGNSLLPSAAVKEQSEELVRQGLLFLLRNKNGDGMWYSGQTTVNVLQTMLELLPNLQQPSEIPMAITVNGARAATINLPPSNQVAAPLVLDLKPYLKPGGNRVELELPRNTPPVSAQLVATYYVPWTSPAAAQPQKVEDSDRLKLDVKYSSLKARAGETIACKVKAERVGYRGYGMMLAEIGLPPGADVDRESLERAVTNDWAISQYDVLPDRIIIYLWPHAGGTEFSFNLKLRFGIEAETGPSELYDYYNPDATVKVKPVRFSNLEPATK